MSEGLGRQTVELIAATHRSLDCEGIPTGTPHYKNIPLTVRTRIHNHRPRGKLLFFQDAVWVPGQDNTTILDNSYRDKQIRIAYSMFESTKIPEEWPKILNEKFDAVAVPDPFLIPIYENCGVTIPIFTLPLGLDLKPFLSSPIKKNFHAPFTFGNLTAGIDRKNLELLIDAFVLAFGDRSDVRLLINSRYTHPQTEEAIQEKLKALAYNNITFNRKCLKPRDYLATFRTLDCYVSLSRGEGFSIQPREAMALGIPVIATDNTAQTTICKSGLVLPVNSNILKPANRTFGTLLTDPITYGDEFDCRVEDAAKALIDMYLNAGGYLSHAIKARSFAAKYDYTESKSLYLSLFKPKKIIVSKSNTIHKDFITTTSERLAKKYAQLFSTPVQM